MPMRTLHGACDRERQLLTASPRCRYVGNKIAVFVLQSLGCDVAALNTVQFSEFLLIVATLA